MTADEWTEEIRSQTQAVGTYCEAYEPAIATLATVLEQRDRAYLDYIEDGARTTIMKESDRGAKNIGINPKLRVWQDLNTQALAYWRDLGLTPAGLKRINESAVKNPQKKSSLVKALEELSG